MKNSALALTLCFLAGPAAFAQEPAKGTKITVLEIDLGDSTPTSKFIREVPDLHKATVITDARKLAEAFPGKAVQEKIARQVDFAKEEILLFAWEDSIREYELRYTVEDGKNGPVVVFRYRGEMFAMDAIHHYAHVFVVPKGTAWRMQGR